MIYAVCMILFGLWVAWIVQSNAREEAAIKEWEQRSGMRFLREGNVKKGGQNGPPRFERPPPPAKMK